VRGGAGRKIHGGRVCQERSSCSRQGNATLAFGHRPALRRQVHQNYRVHFTKGSRATYLPLLGWCHGGFCCMFSGLEKAHLLNAINGLQAREGKGAEFDKSVQRSIVSTVKRWPPGRATGAIRQLRG
jgi:hypothetical protein